MKTVVLGAGVIGVTAACELLRDGHEVTVVDRLGEAASETSYANAGLIAPGHAYAWATPQAPGIMLRSLFDDRQAIRFRPRLDPRQWIWAVQFLRNCTAERALANTIGKAGLCKYSQERLGTVVDETGVDYDRLIGGLLYLYRTEESLSASVEKAKILNERGIVVKAVSPAEAVEIDPALEAVQDRFAGALFAPTDESGDARAFTRHLAAHLERRGVAFRYETEVTGLRVNASKAQAVITDKGEIEADQVMVCLGVFSPDLARTIGIRLPIYPVKGYSVTFPIAGRNNPPSCGGVDQDNLIAYARFGNRLRVTSTAEISGYDKSHRPEDFTHMIKTIRALFPEGADYDQPDYWAGLRPMTPKGVPIFGRGRLENVWMNTGHGHMGWTMACGSARIAADLVAGKRPAVALDGMLLQH